MSLYKFFDKVFAVGFFVFLFALIAGIYLFVTEQAGYTQVVIIGNLASIMIVLSGIYEVWSNKNLRFSNKLFWIVVFIIFNVLACVVYFFIRKKILLSCPDLAIRE